ncbi:hypothetical protein M422DRAFT_267414 [Sphaerobolus stellatus SS14]|uniref:Unplaced genomic scaffold SPHSTscaffold_175, whole genome shotgun sequence n=1 Tax=Sphaerobolus stellatus (strain SS14) TaxID=990650 RepID=A0A0C9V040_SPHS4|nr:hypothetical protein M422DRAFT_267414 [Sphaerobolus stellatus SS14]
MAYFGLIPFCLTLIIVDEANHILKSYEKQLEIFKVKRRLLLDLEDALGDDTIEELQLAADLGDGSQYRPRLIEAPSRQEILKVIQAEETLKNQGDGEELEMRQYVELCLDISSQSSCMHLLFNRQNLRFKLTDHKNPTAKQDNELEESRRKLMKALESWYASLPEFMPPEALQEAQRGLGLLAETEFMLHTGQANDALKKLREALGLKSFLVRRKYKVAQGQSTLLCSETHIQRAQRQVDKWAEVYRRAWVAMGKLQDPGEDGNHGRGRLKCLTHDDLVMLSAWMEQHRLWKEKGEVAQASAAKKGEGRKDLPWIWKLEFETSETLDQDIMGRAVDKWTNEAIRIEWLHTLASKEQFEEELCLLEAESSRIPRTFQYIGRVWAGREEEWAQSVETRVQRGAVAYARRSTKMFSTLAIRADIKHHELLLYKVHNFPKE